MRDREVQEASELGADHLWPQHSCSPRLVPCTWAAVSRSLALTVNPCGYHRKDIYPNLTSNPNPNPNPNCELMWRHYEGLMVAVMVRDDGRCDGQR